MKTNLFAAFLLLPMVLSLGCAAAYKDQVNQQLWLRELRLMEDCNYRLKWQIEDMQHALDEANARIQTLSKETGTLRDRGSSTGPDLTLPPGAAIAWRIRSRQRGADVAAGAGHNGRAAGPGIHAGKIVAAAQFVGRHPAGGSASATTMFRKSVSPARPVRKLAPPIGSIPTSMSIELY